MFSPHYVTISIQIWWSSKKEVLIIEWYKQWHLYQIYFSFVTSNNLGN